MSNGKVFKTIGASNHTDEERQPEDFYATSPEAINVLLDYESFKGTIWEPAAGQGHMSEAIKKYGYEVVSTDLIDRGYCQGGVDFLKETQLLADNIITNPPNKYALDFMKHSMDLLNDGGKLALFLPIRFLASYNRGIFYKQVPPSKILICSSRIMCAKDADFATMEKNGGTAIDYMWLLWEKGYTGPTITDWVNIVSKKK